MPDTVTRRVRMKSNLYDSRHVMRFVDTAQRFESECLVDKGDGAARLNARSAMEMMLLEAADGTEIRIEATGTDAAGMLDALEALIDSGFAE